jgi:tRNA (guanine-N7-)-methyltransferase
MKHGGRIIIATDHPDYATWVAIHVAHIKALEWRVLDISERFNPPAGHITTRYQQKNKAGSTMPVFFEFIFKGKVAMAKEVDVGIHK